jgi:hypothetical protein
MGQPWYGQHDRALERETSAAYFKVLQARRIAGRFYTEADDSSKPRVAVINRALAKRLFPGENPVGRTIGDAELSAASLARVIGVVDDIREGDLVDPLAPALYYPFQQNIAGTLFLVVRTRLDPALMMPSLVRAIHQVDPNLGVRNEFVMEPDQRFAGGLSEPLVGLAVGSICGICAVARSNWTLWRDCLFGGTTNARDRSAHGARSAARGGLSIDPRRGRSAGGSWHRDRAGVFDGRRPIAERPAVWRAVLGRPYVHRRGCGAPDLRAVGELSACPEGGFGESR